MNNYETIRAKVIEANPEIMELKWGCEFRFPGNQNPAVALNGKEWKRIDFIYKPLMLRHKVDRLLAKDMEDIEILGRPIRLSDVLLAIGKDEFDVPWKCGNCHIPRWKIVHSDITGSSVGWNLRKDDLREQSEETISFLADLLK